MHARLSDLLSLWGVCPSSMRGDCVQAYLAGGHRTRRCKQCWSLPISNPMPRMFSVLHIPQSLSLSQTGPGPKNQKSSKKVVLTCKPHPSNLQVSAVTRNARSQIHAQFCFRENTMRACHRCHISAMVVGWHGKIHKGVQRACAQLRIYSLPRNRQ